MRMSKERDLWLLTGHHISEKLKSECNIKFSWITSVLVSNWWSILGVRLAILWSLIRLVHVAHYRQWYFPFTGMPGMKVPAGAQWMTGGCSEISLEISSTEPVVKRPDYRLVSGEVLTPVRQKTQSKDWANETATERPPTRVLLKFFYGCHATSRNVTQYFVHETF